MLLRFSLLVFALTQVSPSGLFACHSANGGLHFGCGCHACFSERAPQPDKLVRAICCDHCQQATSSGNGVGLSSSRACCEHHDLQYAGARPGQQLAPAGLALVAALPGCVLVGDRQTVPGVAAFRATVNSPPPRQAVLQTPLRI